MSHFWVTHGGERRGPYEESEIFEAVELGTIVPTDLLWVQGMREGIPIYQVFAHLGAVPSAAPPSRPGAAPRRARRPGVVDELAALSRDEVAYAGFWVRLAAAALDGALLGSVGLAILAALAWTAPGAPAPLAAAVIAVAAAWLYCAFLESSPGGATFGKHAFRLQVLTADRMQRASFLRATGRFAGRWISAGVLAIGYLMQPFTARRQALHDLLAGTVVVARGKRTHTRLMLAVLCLAPFVFALFAGAALQLLAILGGG